jgi:hypothetical protein
MTSEHEMTGLVKLSRSRGKFAMRWSDTVIRGMATHIRCAWTLPRWKAGRPESARMTLRLAPSPLPPIEEIPEESNFTRNLEALAADTS